MSLFDAQKPNAQTMSTPNYLNAQKYVMQQLEDNLSPMLFYHTIQHTRDHVLQDTEALAETEGVSQEDMLLLRTGALYHDIGFIQQYWNNEPLGVRIAEETLPTFGYTPGQIEVISALILATRFPQSPNNPLESIICDADLFNLGEEEQFWVAADCLIRERIAHRNAIPPEFQSPYSLPEWWEQQCRFLEIHSYFTRAAQRSRAKGQLRNLETLRQLLTLCPEAQCGKKTAPLP